MSLDVYLEGPVQEYPKERSCPICSHGHVCVQQLQAKIFHANITHNLGPMAEAAGIYTVLWRPETLHEGPVYAKELIDRLSVGLDVMLADPAKFRALNAPNGWGTYYDFVPWVRRYLDACKQNPEAIVKASR